jgi:hypothetical protein
MRAVEAYSHMRDSPLLLSCNEFELQWPSSFASSFWTTKKLSRLATNSTARLIRIGEQTVIAEKRFLPQNIFPLFEKDAPPLQVFHRGWGLKGDVGKLPPCGSVDTSPHTNLSPLSTDVNSMKALGCPAVWNKYSYGSVPTVRLRSWQTAG